MLKIRISFILIIIFSVFSLNAQDNYPKDYFISPVNFPVSLSGTFAELRAGHFHSGIDIRTAGDEGKPIVACADGYVARIKISPYGFGKALYIDHPNGYTTVYAHLQKMSPAIDAWLKSEQYKLEKFDVDLFPPKNLLKVKQGEVICYSGNSGSSEGPHLHFEIRNTKTEMPVNPQLFGLPVKDFIRPVISALRISPEVNGGTINGKTTPLIPELTGWGPVYKLKDKNPININGSYSISVQASDLLNGNNNKNGIFRFAVYIDSVLCFDWQAETFNFNETRYINSFIDYSHYYNTGKRYITTRIAPNNKLSMYKTATNQGIFTAIPDSIHHLKIVISDAGYNESILRFTVKGGEVMRSEKNQNNSGSIIFSYQKPNSFSEKGLVLVVPGKSLYDDLDFNYSVSGARPNTCSPVYTLHNAEVPLFDNIDVSVVVDSAYRHLGKKLILARLRKDRSPASAGGKYSNGFLKASIREFGQYTVMADTTAPVIKALNISDGEIITTQQSIRIKISDDFSGIGTYNAYLNGKWILMDYDAKNQLLEYLRDDRLLKGENEFLLTIEDNCGNSSTLKTTIID